MRTAILIIEGVAALLRTIGRLIVFLPLLFLVALFFVPTTPHLRWEYAYIPYGNQKHFVRCTYLGPQGLVTPDIAPDCPLVALINPDQWRRR